jgi:hypothetical protein
LIATLPDRHPGRDLSACLASLVLAEGVGAHCPRFGEAFRASRESASRLVAVPVYDYSEHEIAGHLSRGSISDVSENLLAQMRQTLDWEGAGGWRPIVVNVTGDRMVSADLHGNPFPGQVVGWSVLRRRDPSRWEVATDIALGTSGEITCREGEQIDAREADGWHVIGYVRLESSATPDDATVATVIYESVTVYTREAL